MTAGDQAFLRRHEERLVRIRQLEKTIRAGITALTKKPRRKFTDAQIRAMFGAAKR